MTTEGHRDVVEFFAHLRQRDPVHQDAQGTYVLTRYNDVYDALRDPQTFSSLHELADTPIVEADARSIVYSDDPVHVGLRQLVNRAFTPRGVAQVTDKVVENMTAVVADLVPDEPFDAVQVGVRIARENFAEVLGVPPEERDRLKKWAVAAGMFVRPKIMRGDQAVLRGGAAMPDDLPPEQRAAFDEGYNDMRRYLETLVDEHGEHDLQICVDEGRLTPFGRFVVEASRRGPEAIEEILHRLLPPMMAGGTSTVAHIFPNALDVLLDHPGVWELLRSDRSQLALDKPSEVIEEILRLKSVVQGLARITTRDVEVRGTTIPAGSKVQLFYLSGDHDPEAFENPEEFDYRGITRHLGFGFGTHTCMGQSLVRLELKAFLDALLDKFDRIERVEDPDVVWGGLGVYYTPNKFPVVGRVG